MANGWPSRSCWIYRKPWRTSGVNYWWQGLWKPQGFGFWMSVSCCFFGVWRSGCFVFRFFPNYWAFESIIINQVLTFSFGSRILNKTSMLMARVLHAPIDGVLGLNSSQEVADGPSYMYEGSVPAPRLSTKLLPLMWKWWVHDSLLVA